MNIWIISDTHFNHVNIVKYTGRDPDYINVIRKNWQRLVKPEDMVIHLGDVIFGQDKEINLPVYMKDLPGKKILCRGNHDNKPWDFYAEHGFDIVTDYFVYDRYAFSHAPLTPLPFQTVKEKDKDFGFKHTPVELNIHGHFHNSDHRRQPNDPYFDFAYYEKNEDKYRLIQIEDELRPFTLEEVLAR
jgi:calcineurin-like phosphoesterase family protein